MHLPTFKLLSLDRQSHAPAAGERLRDCRIKLVLRVSLSYLLNYYEKPTAKIT